MDSERQKKIKELEAKRASIEKKISYKNKEKENWHKKQKYIFVSFTAVFFLAIIIGVGGKSCQNDETEKFNDGYIITGGETKKATWGDPETGLILKYDIRKDQDLNYMSSSDATLFILAMGQSTKSILKNNADYVIKGIGTDEQSDLTTQITINDWTFSLHNPQAPINPDTSSLKGKSFNVTYSPKGKEIENVEIDDLPKVSMGIPNVPPLNAKYFFSNLLPKLPDDKIKIGDTWTTPEDEKRQVGHIEVTFKGETINTLEGLENIHGMECVRIKSQTKGATRGTGTLVGQDYKVTDGDSNATTTWYFAYKKGIFVKSIAEGIGSMKISLGPLDMPLIMKGKTTLELVQ